MKIYIYRSLNRHDADKVHVCFTKPKREEAMIKNMKTVRYWHTSQPTSRKAVEGDIEEGKLKEIEI